MRRTLFILLRARALLVRCAILAINSRPCHRIRPSCVPASGWSSQRLRKRLVDRCSGCEEKRERQLVACAEPPEPSALLATLAPPCPSRLAACVCPGPLESEIDPASAYRSSSRTTVDTASTLHLRTLAPISGLAQPFARVWGRRGPRDGPRHCLWQISVQGGLRLRLCPAVLGSDVASRRSRSCERRPLAIAAGDPR